MTNRGPGEMLDRCLTALRAAGGADHVIVVDNSGVAPSPVDADSVVRVDNRGFGAAANAGAVLARELAGEDVAIALLNDDVEVTPGWLAPLRAALDAAPDIGAVQPKLLLLSDPARVNSVGVQLDEFGAGSDIGHGDVDDHRFVARDIEMFTGGAVLLRGEFLDATGGFDERYFLYYEDVDLSQRGAELGWRFRCEPASVVLHALGATTEQLGDERVRLQERNRLVAAARFAPFSTWRQAVWLSIRRLRHAPRRAHARALLGGLWRTPRALIERRRTGQRS